MKIRTMLTLALLLVIPFILTGHMMAGDGETEAAVLRFRFDGVPLQKKQVFLLKETRNPLDGSKWSWKMETKATVWWEKVLGSDKKPCLRLNVQVNGIRYWSGNPQKDSTDNAGPPESAAIVVDEYIIPGGSLTIDFAMDGSFIEGSPAFTTKNDMESKHYSVFKHAAGAVVNLVTMAYPSVDRSELDSLSPWHPVLCNRAGMKATLKGLVTSTAVIGISCKDTLEGEFGSTLGGAAAIKADGSIAKVSFRQVTKLPDVSMEETRELESAAPEAKTPAEVQAENMRVPSLNTPFLPPPAKSFPE